MIDTKSAPLHAGPISDGNISLTPRTALLFNMLATGAAALAALLPLGVVFYWALVERADILRQMGFSPEVLGELDFSQRLGAAIVTALTVLPLSWGLLRLRVCFSEFAKGRPFAARGIAGLRDFATGMVVAVLAKPVGYTVLTLLLSWNAPPGQRQLAIQIDSDTLIMALFAATIAALAWAMEKAAAIAEDNSQIV